MTCGCVFRPTEVPGIIECKNCGLSYDRNRLPERIEGKIEVYRCMAPSTFIQVKTEEDNVCLAS